MRPTLGGADAGKAAATVSHACSALERAVSAAGEPPVDALVADLYGDKYPWGDHLKRGRGSVSYKVASYPDLRALRSQGLPAGRPGQPHVRRNVLFFATSCSAKAARGQHDAGDVRHSGARLVVEQGQHGGRTSQPAEP